MRRDAPPFLLGGAEIALVLIGLRVALWVWRGWRHFDVDAPPPPEPPGPRGKPHRVPVKPAPSIRLRPGIAWRRAS